MGNLKTKVILIIIFPITVMFTKGDRFLPQVLKSKITNILLTSNSTNHKLWMKYLEKRLATVNMNVIMTRMINKQKFSLLEFHKAFFKRRIFWGVYISCKMSSKKEPKGRQTDIFGDICGSPNHGQQVPPRDLCPPPPSNDTSNDTKTLKLHLHFTEVFVSNLLASRSCFFFLYNTENNAKLESRDITLCTSTYGPIFWYFALLVTLLNSISSVVN